MATKKKAKKPAKRKAEKKTTKRKPSAAFMKPMQPSAALSEVIGSKPIPRTEVTKKLGGYIKREGPQGSARKQTDSGGGKQQRSWGPTSRGRACRTRRIAGISTPTPISRQSSA